METTHEFVLPAGSARERPLNAIDLLPGTPSVVRDVVVSIRTPGAGTRVLGRWTPRQIPVPVAVAARESVSSRSVRAMANSAGSGQAPSRAERDELGKGVPSAGRLPAWCYDT